MSKGPALSRFVGIRQGLFSNTFLWSLVRTVDGTAKNRDEKEFFIISRTFLSSSRNPLLSNRRFSPAV